MVGFVFLHTMRMIHGHVIYNLPFITPHIARLMGIAFLFILRFKSSVPGTGENFVESESSDEEIEVEENSQSKSQESVVEDVAKAQNLAPGLRGKIYVFMTEPSSSTLVS